MRLAKRLGLHALTRHVTVIRSVLKYAYDADLIEKPVKLGKGFSKPSAAQKRKAKHKAEADNGKRLFTPLELKRILDVCLPELKAPVLLGINGGFGNTDCGTLPNSAVDFEAGVITYARPKTGVPRVVPLWPETLRAIQSVLASARPKPIDEHAAKLVFLTRSGRPLVRQIVTQDEKTGIIKVANVDRISTTFASLLERLQLHRPRIGFYTLCHTFRTWADETRDQHAIRGAAGEEGW
jgi:integrase